MPTLEERIKSRTSLQGKGGPITSVAAEVRQMVQGDHWLNGQGWIGPKPADDKAKQVLGLIRSQFVWKNVIAEVCRRHRNSVVGQEPLWSMTVDRYIEEGESPTDEEAALVLEAENALTGWWDHREVHAALKQAAMKLLWSQDAETLEGVAALRLYIPDRLLQPQEDGTKIVPRGGLEEVIDYIYVHALDPLQGGLLRDQDGVEMLGYYHWKEENKSYVELNGLAETFRREGLMERTDTLYEDQMTVVQIRDLDTWEVLDQGAYDLGGRLLTIEMRREETLVSPSMVSLQKMLNLAYTAMARNVVQGGFLERTIMNAQLPGRFVDEAGNPSDAGTKFEPEPFQVGAGSLNFLAGLPIRNEMGEITGYAPPSITYKDPVPVTTFEDTARNATRAIYEEAQQLHVLISGDSTSSGESRKQATNDFVSSLGDTSRAVEQATRQLLETVMAWASYFSDDQRFIGLRAEANAVITAVQPTPDEIRANLEQFNAGVLSRETTMTRNGVEDVSAELQRLERELKEDMAARAAFELEGAEPGAKTERDEAEANRAEASRETVAA